MAKSAHQTTRASDRRTNIRPKADRQERRRQKAEARRHYRRGLFVGSFDPMTNGHWDIVIKAARFCDEVLVVVAKNPAKKSLMTAARRVEIIESYIARSGLKNVRAFAYDGLAADCYVEHGCDVYIRGVRDSKDLYEEESLTDLNRYVQDMKVELVWQRDRALKSVSSSNLKGFALFNVSVPTFAPGSVRAEVEWRARGIIRIGVIGGIACGKSSVTKALVRRLRARYGADFVHHIDMDALLREAYDGSSAGSDELRAELVRRFGDEVLMPGGKAVDRAFLKQRLFGDTPKAKRELRWVEDITTKHVMRLYRQQHAGKYGLLFIEMAHMLERGVDHLVSNRIIQVDSSDREVLADKRQIPSDRRAAIRKTQWSSDRRREVVTARIKYEGGFLLEHDNRLGDLPSNLDELGLETPIPAIDALVERLRPQIDPYWEHIASLAASAAKAT